uniref:Uncharacterized protein n=1 Tax=Anguilla anguilla TaxID=7936 RepID=A0A0E9SA50_ANGAN
MNYNFIHTYIMQALNGIKRSIKKILATVFTKGIFHTSQWRAVCV